MQQIPWSPIPISLAHLCFICWEFRLISCWQGPISSRYRSILPSALGLSRALEQLGLCINTALRWAMLVLPSETSAINTCGSHASSSLPSDGKFWKKFTLSRSPSQTESLCLQQRLGYHTLVSTLPLLLSHSPCSFTPVSWNHLLHMWSAAKSLSHPLLSVGAKFSLHLT